ncbi:MAG: DUF3488 and transglutaminase-like domain-containing protein [Planctomycetota bacterium]
MDVAQRFRRLAFVQVVLGVLSFCLAAEDPALLLLVGAIVVLSWYVTEGPAAWGLHRVWVNLAALVAVGWLGVELLRTPEAVLSAMGRFIMVLQVLILYMRKSNREYAQLLVLSLLQMAVASVLPGGESVVYGVLLGVYGLVGLLTVLLMHLKMSADEVEETRAAAVPVGVEPGTMAVSMGRGHGWHLRALAGVLALVCFSVGVLVFVATPRTGQGMMGLEAQHGAGETRARVGFTDEVRLGGPPINAGTGEAVLNVSITDPSGENVGGDGPAWLMRGAVLDRYDPSARTWRRSKSQADGDVRVRMVNDRAVLLSTGEGREPSRNMYRATVTTLPGRMRYLFTPRQAMGGTGAVVTVRSDRLTGVVFNGKDQQLTLTDAPRGAFTYEVDWWSSARPGLEQRYEEHLALEAEALISTGMTDGPRWYDLRAGEHITHEQEAAATTQPEDGQEAEPAREKTLVWSVGRKRVRALAKSVIRSALDERNRESPGAIARVLSDYLRREYRYTLDNPPSANDPVLAFLFEHKQGHCELFASGLVAMCRSVGVPARIVTGYRASEFNAIGGYYVVRQTDAHAWVEVKVGEAGPWRVMDPTPGGEETLADSRERAWWLPMVHFYEHLEYWWVRSVMAYDESTRQELLAGAESVVDRSREEPGGLLHAVSGWWQWLESRLELDMLGLVVLSFVGTALALGLGLLLRLYVLRRRRLMALHLEKLPRNLRFGLTRRLRFYLTMLELLERHGYDRPPWQSPFEFAEELAESDPMRFDPVLALTEQFYAVRFGHRDMDEPRRRLVKTHLRRLQANLGERGHA